MKWIVHFRQHARNYDWAKVREVLRDAHTAATTEDATVSATASVASNSDDGSDNAGSDTNVEDACAHDHALAVNDKIHKATDIKARIGESVLRGAGEEWESSKEVFNVDDVLDLHYHEN